MHYGRLGSGNHLRGTAVTVVLGSATPVLVPLVALVAIRVGELARRSEQRRSLGDLAEAGSHPDDQPQDQEKTHRRAKIASSKGGRKVAP